MKITIESTDKIICVDTGKREDFIECRLWEGETDSGIKVVCLIPRISAKDDQDLTQFEQELKVCKTPSIEVQAWPLRLII